MDRKIPLWPLLAVAVLGWLFPEKPHPHIVEAIFGIDDIIVAIVVSIVISVISQVLMPKPQTAKPEAATDWENPTAEAGRPIPVVFGTITVTGGNILWFGDKSIKQYQVKA